jgi:probable HAF family extracellular repeat protein
VALVNLRFSRTISLLISVWIFCSVLQVCTYAEIEYEVIDLGTLGGNESTAYSINNTGQIVGIAEYTEFYGHATLFDPTGDGNNIDLGTLGGIYISSSTATSINDVGQIVGYSRGFFRGGGAPPPAHATLFDPNGTFNNIVLHALGGSSFAHSINNAGQIVGSAGGAVLFDPTGAGNNVELGTLGGRRSEAFSINDTGQIVGGAENDQGDYHATLFDLTGAGDNTDLSSLGDIMSVAYSINNLGDIVGTEDGRATLFDVTGAGNNIDLGIIEDFDFSMALSINDVRQIVGITYYEFDNTVHTRGTLFDPTGAGNNIDLNTLIDPNSGWTLERANDINNNGWIVGSGINPEGLSHAFLLVPISTKYSGGTGEPNDPYQIATAEDLILLGETPDDYDKHFIMTADIDLDPNMPGRKVFDRAVIAPDTNDVEDWFHGTPFSGIFEGNGHTISHLKIEGDSFLGLFGWLYEDAKVLDLRLESMETRGLGSYIGGLAGWNAGDITHCYSSGSVQGGTRVGGLTGLNHGTASDRASSISMSQSAGTVSGQEEVGGLVGSNEGGIIASRSSAIVTGLTCVGGLTGSNSYPFTAISGLLEPPRGYVEVSYSSGTVSGDDQIGGLVGCNCGFVSMSYSTGVVSGTGDNIGGLENRIGDCWGDGITTDSFWDTQTSGQTVSDGGTSKITVEMQTAATYLEAGWDFVDETENGTEDIWWIDEWNDYPRLWWEAAE